ncbi:hypothetical protein RZO55_04540 [Clostridium boliviensis]|uniref:Septum formation initiator family protein n=1 Tax=Clostridium boliviensis TaxID=318465 RepID=A0ABU4GGZ7_9CLOT|nr:hypothetical protein [Clostridium boliviensis]MDW2796846.1 hypothetical protein [Clostridium boliviensis]
MRTISKKIRIWHYNNKKKPWRNFKWAFDPPKKRRGLYCLLYCCLVLEGVFLLPWERDKICGELKKLYTVREDIIEETRKELPFEDETKTELRERGISMDLKEGEIKLWQRVERQIFDESD